MDDDWWEEAGRAYTGHGFGAPEVNISTGRYDGYDTPAVDKGFTQPKPFADQWSGWEVIRIDPKLHKATMSQDGPHGQNIRYVDIPAAMDQKWADYIMAFSGHDRVGVLGDGMNQAGVPLVAESSGGNLNPSDIVWDPRGESWLPLRTRGEQGRMNAGFARDDELNDAWNNMWFKNHPAELIPPARGLPFLRYGPKLLRYVNPRFAGWARRGAHWLRSGLAKWAPRVRRGLLPTMREGIEEGFQMLEKAKPAALGPRVEAVPTVYRTGTGEMYRFW